MEERKKRGEREEKETKKRGMTGSRLLIRAQCGWIGTQIAQIVFRRGLRGFLSAVSVIPTEVEEYLSLSDVRFLDYARDDRDIWKAFVIRGIRA